jgi:TPR repeat protein
VKWFTQAAEAGNAEAQGNLGLIYKDGLGGIKQDLLTAANWLALAGSQGHIASQNRLAGMFENGQGVPKSMPEAARWYQMAAEAGDKTAQNNLGVFYRDGIGMEMNVAKALAWFQKSADQGYTNAKLNLDQLSEKLAGPIK